MYYSSGNYEAFARPRKPEGVDGKTAWFVGSGLASLSGAAFLIRDGHMDGANITILERLKLPGGALDGIKAPKKGFVIRGGREMEDHMECLWDLFRSVPSIEVDGASVLDEFYWLDKDDPNYSLQRVTEKQGQDARTDGLFTLSEKAQKEVTKVFLAPREEMEGKRINEVFSADFLASNFWLYWRTMFAFEEWHSALEMKLYLHRFIHHVGGLPDFTALKFTKYNQKLLARKSAEKTSLMRLPSISARGARNILVTSFCAFSLRVNRPSVWASWPCFSVTRCREELGSSLSSQ